MSFVKKIGGMGKDAMSFLLSVTAVAHMFYMIYQVLPSLRQVAFSGTACESLEKVMSLLGGSEAGNDSIKEIKDAEMAVATLSEFVCVVVQPAPKERERERERETDTSTINSNFLLFYFVSQSSLPTRHAYILDFVNIPILPYCYSPVYPYNFLFTNISLSPLTFLYFKHPLR